MAAKIKIAILSNIPLHSGMSGKVQELKNIIDFLWSKDAEIAVFSLSSKMAVYKEDKYIEREFQDASLKYRSLLNPASHLAILLLNFKVDNYISNRNINMIRALVDFDPDVIILGTFLLAGILQRVLNGSGKKIKVISTFDSPAVIDNFTAPIYQKLHGKIPEPALRQYIRNYKKYNMKLYSKTLKASDFLVLPTELDMNAASHAFPEQEKKIIYVPKQFVRSDVKAGRIRRSIKTIAFFGNYAYPPNRSAIEDIAKYIAPRLPEKKFIVFGNGCPVKKISNIEYLGAVENQYDVLRDVDLCIAPLSIGSGFKVKILDYFTMHKAVIGTDIAFQGFHVANHKNAIIENDIKKYPEVIRNLEKNKKRFYNMQKASHSAVEEFDKGKISAKWKRLVSVR